GRAGVPVGLTAVSGDASAAGGQLAAIESPSSIETTCIRRRDDLARRAPSHGDAGVRPTLPHPSPHRARRHGGSPNALGAGRAALLRHRCVRLHTQYCKRSMLALDVPPARAVVEALSRPTDANCAVATWEGRWTSSRPPGQSTQTSDRTTVVSIHRPPNG